MRTVIAALLIWSSAGMALAQDATIDPRDQAPVYSAWFAGGWHAPISNYSPLRTDRVVMLFGIERRYRLTTRSWGEISLTPTFLPAAYTTGNRHQTPGVCEDSKGFYDCGIAIGIPYSAFGVGALPLAFRAQTRGDRRISVGANADGGGAWFMQRVPASRGTHFNFIARFGADVTLRLTNRTWLTGGYRHLHMSNGGTGAINPGIDTPLMTFGIAWR